MEDVDDVLGRVPLAFGEAQDIIPGVGVVDVIGRGAPRGFVIFDAPAGDIAVRQNTVSLEIQEVALEDLDLEGGPVFLPHPVDKALAVNPEMAEYQGLQGIVGVVPQNVEKFSIQNSFVDNTPTPG